MSTVATAAIASNPDQVRALLALRKAGWRRKELCRALGISPATYYRRLAEAEALRRRLISA